MGIFGTDGVRGRAGQGPLTAASALCLGAAFAEALGGGPVAIARDTRQSGPMLQAAVTAGLLSAGADVIDLGVLPTPALSFWTEKSAARGGVMITASHNAWPDNGIKLFAGDGTKVPDPIQERVEALWNEGFEASGEAGTVRDEGEPASRTWMASLDGRTLGGRTIVVDDAAGAAAGLLARAVEARGGLPIAIAPAPDGRNINEGVGALHPEGLKRAVLAEGAWAGVALDGDADRLLIVDEAGTEHDGDAVLGFLADRHLASGQTLEVVVGTVTSNAGLEQYLKERGVRLHRTPVGDRHVAAAMVKLGAPLGGESSGHVLTPALCPSGDGTRVALEVLSAAAADGRPLSTLLGAVPRFPSAKRKVAVPRKPSLDCLPDLQALLLEADAALQPAGARQLLRYSGTEPVLRVQVEGPDRDLVETWADRLAAGAEQAIAEHAGA